MRALAIALCLAALLPTSAGAEGWAGFYTKHEPDPPPAPAVSPALTPASAPAAQDPARIRAGDACVAAILDAQRRYRIPGNLLLAIGFQEAGLSRGGQLTVWPWSVNAAGDGRMFDTRQAAQDWVRAQLKAGTGSIDVGCMQVNLRWHPEAFATLDVAFDPASNVDYAARFLRDLYRRTGDWMTAAGSYHSFSTEERNRYLAALDQNLKVANARAARAPDVQLAAVSPDAPDLPAPAPAPRPPQPKIGWSAALSAGQDPRRLSIYSTQGLQPVLPNFIQEF